MDCRSVIFDFDYTLADSSAGQIECSRYALRKMGLAVPEKEVILRTIGPSFRECFRILTGEDDAVRSAEYLRLFVERADEVMLDLIELYDSVRPVVTELRRNGINLGIVSTKYRYRIEAFLQREGLAKEFTAIIGGEDGLPHKPNPAGILAVLGRLECAPDHALYVGDHTVDAEAARQAGVAFVAVLTGVTPQEDFREYSPRAIIDNLKTLPDLVN